MFKTQKHVHYHQYSCDVQESYTSKDPPSPPSDILLFPPLTGLHTSTLCIQELPTGGITTGSVSFSTNPISSEYEDLGWKVTIDRSRLDTLSRFTRDVQDHSSSPFHFLTSFVLVALPPSSCDVLSCFGTFCFTPLNLLFVCLFSAE